MKPLPLVSKKLMKLLDVLVHISGYNTNRHIFLRNQTGFNSRDFKQTHHF